MSAFVQAKLKKLVWIHPPRGFHSTLPGRTCLRLLKTLYRLRVTPHLWLQHFEKALHELGLKPSAIDPCLFIKPGMILMLVTYINDCKVSAQDPADINRLIEDLTQMGFELTLEGSFSEFFGIKIAPMGNEI